MTDNAALQERRALAIPRGIANAFPVYASRAENSELWDVEGRRYIDFAGGIAVLNTGHRHPRVMAAVREQLDLYTHTAFQIVPYEPYVELCERLNELAPFPGPAKSILFSTGAEAVENAVKIARAHTGRPGVVAFAGAFHGRTSLTSALTGKVVPYKKAFGISPPGIYHVPFPSESNGVDVGTSLTALETLFRSDIDPSQVAAIIIEPVQGEGGFLPAPAEFLVALRKIADQHKILLIVDEVQTGFARTGRMFGIEHSGVAPDLMTVAKSIAGGLPLSGVIGKAHIMDSVDAGGLGTTYGGNPLAVAAALAVLDVIKDEKLVDRANTLGGRSRNALEAMSRRNDAVPIANIRGPGAMIAFDIIERTATNRPDPEAAKRVVQAAMAEGLVLLTCGIHGNTIRLLFPLTISNDLLDNGLTIIERALVRARV